MEMANARMIEKNAFILLKDSFLTARMRLSDGRRVAALKAFGAGPARIRTWDQGIMSPLLLPLSYRPKYLISKNL
jgi:hypothetical protein